MGNLEYNASELDGLGRRLTRIHSDLENEKQLKRYDRDDVGHQRVASAIDHFVDDWDDKRNRLAKSVGQLGEMSSTSAQTFTDADRDLAETLLEKQQ